MFKIANAGKILIQPAAVAITQVALQIARLIRDGVENALAGIQLMNPRVDFLGRALKKKLLKDA